MLASISGYEIGVFIHVLAVVVAFGPTFAYGLFMSTAAQHPRAVPALLTGIQRTDRYLVNPMSLLVLAAGIYLLVDGNWDAGESWISVGFVAIVVLLGLQHAFFRPSTAKLMELAERDLGDGGELGDEFHAISRRVANVGMLAGLVVVVTIFFMVVKP